MTDLSFQALRPDYAEKWAIVSKPGGVTHPHEAQKEAAAILGKVAQIHFRQVEKRTGVPWFVTGIILTREAGSPPNFEAWLHNGDHMHDHVGRPRHTVNIPSHRPPNPDCSWEDGAVDAYTIEGLLHKSDWSPEFVAWVLEKFNGYGYRTRGIPSPYLWGCTVVQKPGKFDKDHEFDPSEMDTQIGGLALLATLMEMDAEIKFTNGG